MKKSPKNVVEVVLVVVDEVVALAIVVVWLLIVGACVLSIGPLQIRREGRYICQK